MGQILNPKFAKVVALMRSTTHPGERNSATAKARAIAAADGKTLDRAIAEMDRLRDDAIPGHAASTARSGWSVVGQRRTVDRLRSSHEDLLAQLGLFVGSSDIGADAETALLKDLQAIVAADGTSRVHAPFAF